MALENQELVPFEIEENKTSINVRLNDETVWLSLNQLSHLFERDKSVISRHLKNIFQEELDKDSVVANFATTAVDKKIYQVEHYSLDAIISLGYRVNSKRGIKFRQWATQLIKNHLRKEYVQRNFVPPSIAQHQTHVKPKDDIEQIINRHEKTWSLLLAYDEDRIIRPELTFHQTEFNYNDAISHIQKLKEFLIRKGEASCLFGQDQDGKLKGILGNIHQTFDDSPLYPSLEEKAAHLLYFIIKDHPFIDGNKRIGTLLFLNYLKSQNYPAIESIGDLSLTPLALVIAESEPSKKRLIIEIIIKLIYQKPIQELTDFEERKTFILLYERAIRTENIIQEIKAIMTKLPLQIDVVNTLSSMGIDFLNLLFIHNNFVQILYNSMFERSNWEEGINNTISPEAYSYKEEHMKLHFDTLNYVNESLIRQNNIEAENGGFYLGEKSKDMPEYAVVWRKPSDHAYKLEPLITLIKNAILQTYKNKFGSDLPKLLPYENLEERPHDL